MQRDLTAKYEMVNRICVYTFGGYGESELGFYFQKTFERVFGWKK